MGCMEGGKDGTMSIIIFRLKLTRLLVLCRDMLGALDQKHSTLRMWHPSSSIGRSHEKVAPKADDS